jgi:hypothetical protein
MTAVVDRDLRLWSRAAFISTCATRAMPEIRHPEVLAKRASKDERPRHFNKRACSTAGAVALRGSLREHLRVTVLIFPAAADFAERAYDSRVQVQGRELAPASLNAEGVQRVFRLRTGDVVSLLRACGEREKKAHRAAHADRGAYVALRIREDAFFSLPPCGGGSGWGVVRLWHGHASPADPHPRPLPARGRGDGSAAQRPGGGDGGAANAALRLLHGCHPTPDCLRQSDPPPPGEGAGEGAP